MAISGSFCDTLARHWALSLGALAALQLASACATGGCPEGFEAPENAGAICVQVGLNEQLRASELSAPEPEQSASSTTAGTVAPPPAPGADTGGETPDEVDLKSCGPCADATPICNTQTGQCEACTAHAQCGSLLCDQSSGRCIECKPGVSLLCGPGKSCDALTFLCTDEDQGSAQVCDYCVSDEHCADGMRCVDASLAGGQGRSVCLPQVALNPGPATGSTAPYENVCADFSPVLSPSTRVFPVPGILAGGEISSNPAMPAIARGGTDTLYVCGPSSTTDTFVFATCESVRALREARSCATGGDLNAAASSCGYDPSATLPGELGLLRRSTACVKPEASDAASCSVRCFDVADCEALDSTVSWECVSETGMNAVSDTGTGQPASYCVRAD